MLTADQTTAGTPETFDWIELSNGDVVLRAYGGGGHLLSTFTHGKDAGKMTAAGDDASVEAMKTVDGTQPSGPPPPGGGDVHVESIVMSTSTAGGNRTRGVAVVKIVDTSGAPVDGVTVYGDWTGLTTGSVSGVTGTDGRATLNSNLVRNANGTFTFTVTNVQGAGYTYNPSLNVETSDSITVP